VAVSEDGQPAPSSAGPWGNQHHDADDDASRKKENVVAFGFLVFIYPNFTSKAGLIKTKA
jgi:hypothetical protein